MSTPRRFRGPFYFFLVVTALGVAYTVLVLVAWKRNPDPAAITILLHVAPYAPLLTVWAAGRLLAVYAAWSALRPPEAARGISVAALGLILSAYLFAKW